MQFSWHTKFLLPPFNEPLLILYAQKVYIGSFEKGPCRKCGDTACFQPKFTQKNFSECIRLSEISGWCLPSELRPYNQPIEIEAQRIDDVCG